MKKDATYSVTAIRLSPYITSNLKNDEFNYIVVMTTAKLMDNKITVPLTVELD